MGIKEKHEHWEGFGKEELRGSLIFIGINLVINIVFNLLFGNVFYFMAVTILSIVTALMIYTKGNTNLSVVDQIKNMISFSKSQKRYYYKTLDEWKY